MALHPGPEDAAVRAVNAGVDMEMTRRRYRDTLAEAVKQGLVKQSTIDEAVRGILMAKYRLGLFQQILTLRRRERRRSW